MVQDEPVQSEYSSLLAASYTHKTGSICPPWPDQMAATDRVNFVLFWSMAKLIEEMSNEMSRAHPEFEVASEDTVVDALLLAPTQDNARDHPIFLQLEHCLAKL